MQDRQSEIKKEIEINHTKVCMLQDIVNSTLEDINKLNRELNSIVNKPKPKHMDIYRSNATDRLYIVSINVLPSLISLSTFENRFPDGMTTQQFYDVMDEHYTKVFSKDEYIIDVVRKKEK
jgi:hypothetical protein